MRPLVIVHHKPVDAMPVAHVPLAIKRILRAVGEDDLDAHYLCVFL